jgi:hypothetical protein
VFDGMPFGFGLHGGRVHSATRLRHGAVRSPSLREPRVDMVRLLGQHVHESRLMPAPHGVARRRVRRRGGRGHAAPDSVLPERPAVRFGLLVLWRILRSERRWWRRVSTRSAGDVPVRHDVLPRRRVLRAELLRCADARQFRVPADSRGVRWNGVVRMCAARVRSVVSRARQRDDRAPVPGWVADFYFSAR